MIALSANAQFQPSGAQFKDVLSAPLTVATLATSNNTTSVYIGKDGFSVTPTLVGTNAGTAVVAFYAYPVINGVTNQTSTYLGTIAMNGTTVVKTSILVAPSVFYGTGFIQLSLTNAHTASVIVSNLVVGAF